MSLRTVLPFLLLLLLAAGVLHAGALQTEEDDTPEGPRGYVGVLGRNVTVRGEFTGDIYLTDGSQVLFVPTVPGSWGFGGLLGMRSGNFAIEGFYAWSPHDGMWGVDTLESRLSTYGMNVRWYPVRLGILEPFALGGVSFYELKVLGGATDGSDFRDETFHGIGLDLGGGIRIGLGARLSLVAQAVYHWAQINTVDDFDGYNVTITDGLDADGFDYGAMITVSF